MTQATSSTLQAFLDTLASSTPVPGGGSAAALTGAIGVSLLVMVASMARTRHATPEDTADLAAAAARLRPLRDELMMLIDDDGEAYSGVLAAYRLAKATDQEKAARTRAIDAAMRRATSVPLQTMRACEGALREAAVIVRSGNPNAMIDAAVGARLLMTALECAAMNVTVNLPGVADADFVRTAGDERQTLLERAATLVRQVEELLPQ